jgi:hypothetical protein
VRLFVRRALMLFLIVMLLPGIAGAQSLRGYDAKAGYQYIAMGTWPQGENGETEPILWRVLTTGENEVLLLSEYILGNHCVHAVYEDYVDFGGVWKLTDMYDFLNDTFMPKAFSGAEQAVLLNSEELGTVFLPASEDLSNKAYGFLGNKSRMGKGTAYALANGLFKYSTKFSPYWTRTQSTTLISGARCTKVSGGLGYIRVVVENLGWRPACRVKLDAAKIASGEGTLDSPFVLSLKERP